MKILAIDTSSKFLSIALSELPLTLTLSPKGRGKGEGKSLIEESHLLDRRHSDLLVPKIKGMLEKVNLSIDDVDVFVIGLGPGSFTGLRIGVSAVKGFGVATGKPCIGVPSIDAIAMNVEDYHSRRRRLTKSPWVVPIIDAKRENVYSAIYGKQKGKIIRKSEYLLLAVDRLIKKTKGDCIFLGDGISLYRDKIQHLNKKAVFLGEEYWYPRASNLIRLAKLKKNPGLNTLKPIYMYAKDCQVRKS